MGNKIDIWKIVKVVVLLSLLWTKLAVAQEISFVVPVALTDMTSVQSINVVCVISRKSLGGSQPWSAANEMARGDTVVQVNKVANFMRDVRVTVDLSGSIDPPESARSYGCSISFSGHARNGVAYNAQPDNMVDIYNRATGRSLVERVKSVRGNIYPADIVAGVSLYAFHAALKLF